MKNNKGYSLIEIGIGILILTAFLLVSVGLFNGCYTNYRRIKQRNLAMDKAVEHMEDMLQTDSAVLTGIFEIVHDSDGSYRITPKEEIIEYTIDNFDTLFKKRYATFMNVEATEITTVPTSDSDDLKNYILDDKDFVISEFVANDAKTASKSELLAGQYGFVLPKNPDGTTKTELVYEYQNNNEVTNFDVSNQYISSSEGNFKVRRTISRIPIPEDGNIAYGNAVLRLKVEVFYTYTYKDNLKSDEMESIVLESVKITKNSKS